MIPALNVNIYFTQKTESILSTETTMIAISSHLWNNLILIVHHIAADIHVYLCWRELVLIRRLSKRLWDTLVLWHSQRKYIHTLISGLNSFRINKTLKQEQEYARVHGCLNSFRINKTLKLRHNDSGISIVWIPSVLTRLSNSPRWPHRNHQVWIPSVLTRLSNITDRILSVCPVWIPSVLTRLSNLKSGSRRVVIFLR